jgi:hypothetical protein
VKAYRFFAYFIALEVVIQAAAIAFGVFGESHWIMEDGGVVNKAVIDDESAEFTGVAGFMIHGINGTMVVPLVALIFLIVSFFAKVPGGVKAAAIVFGLVVLQVVLGISAHDVVWLGPLHAINAFGILTMAILAGKRAGAVEPAPAAAAV